MIVFLEISCTPFFTQSQEHVQDKNALKTGCKESGTVRSFAIPCSSSTIHYPGAMHYTNQRLLSVQHSSAYLSQREQLQPLLLLTGEGATCLLASSRALLLLHNRAVDRCDLKRNPLPYTYVVRKRGCCLGLSLPRQKPHHNIERRYEALAN